MRKINFNTATKYEQIYKIIKDTILHSYHENDKFLSENELAKHFKVNRTTINKVICALVNENLLFRIQGKGTFIKKRKKSLGLCEDSNSIKIQIVFSKPQIFMKESNPITWFICFDIFRGILDACPRYGIYATVADLSEKDDLETKRQRLLDGKTQGFIFIQTSGYEDIIEELKEKRCPVVIAHGTGEEKNIGSIVLDRKKGTYDAVQYLIKLGHRRIGFLSGSISSLYYRSKLAGYTKALNDNGIPIENELIQECEEPKCEKLKFLELKHRPTAIFACSDYRALDAMRLIKRKGLSIPEDMALIGVDDMPDAETSNPPLTTLHAPNYQSGVEAMELLVKLIKNKSLKKKQIFLAMNLIIRKTCGGA